MLRLSSASLALVVSSSATLLLLGCGDDAPPATGGVAGSSLGGSPGAAGALGASGAALVGGAGATAGGALGPAGSSSSSGMSGTGPGGGSGAAAGGSAGQGGGASNCNGALLCDDFESYTAAPGAPWTVRKNAQGSVVIDGAQHNSGSKAVKFSLSGAASYQQALITVEQPFPIAGNAFYGRMMLYTAAASNDGVHWTMIQGEGPVTTPLAADALIRYGGQHAQRFMANYETGGDVATDCWQHSQTKLPEGKWACLEWYFEGATNTQKLWLDGTAVADMTVTGQGEGCGGHDTEDNWYFPAFERLAVGWESYQTDAPREVWIDDVAIGTTQIGCPE